MVVFPILFSSSYLKDEDYTVFEFDSNESHTLLKTILFNFLLLLTYLVVLGLNVAP